MEDAEIIDLYWQRDQRAIDETHGKYGGFLTGIAWNILRCHGDAEECVNDTYLRTWNAIPPPAPPPSGPGWGASSGICPWTGGSRAGPPGGAATAWRCCWGS